MSLLEPEDPLAGLDFEIEEPTVVDIAALPSAERTRRSLVLQVKDGAVIDVTKLRPDELSAFRTWVREELLELGEMHTPAGKRSEYGDALHSVWIACHVAWQKGRPE